MDTVIILLFAVVSVFIVAGLLQAWKYQKTKSVAHLQGHRSLMRSVFFLVVVGVLVLEVAIRLGYIHSGGHEFFWVHLAFAIPFFVLMTVLVFWKNGISSPIIHKKLGYICLGSFVGALVTGLIFLLT